MQKSLRVLERNRKVVFRKMLHTDELIKGTLIEMHNTCGKANCKCQKGEKHDCLGLSYYGGGKSETKYIPEVIEKDVRKYVKNYKSVMKSINEISALNMEIMDKRR